MPPLIRCNLARLRQLDHVHQRRVAALPAGSAPESRLRASRSVYPVAGVWRQRQAGVGLEQLRSTLSHPRPPLNTGDRRRRFGGAIAFHADRPRVSIGVICLTKGRCVALASGFSAHLRAADLASDNSLRLGHGRRLRRHRAGLEIHEFLRIRSGYAASRWSSRRRENVATLAPRPTPVSSQPCSMMFFASL